MLPDGGCPGWEPRFLRPAFPDHPGDQLRESETGSLVNLERAMSAMDRFGGHFVMGHVDNTGTIAALEPVGQDHRLEVRIPDELARYCIDKGSITIDGIS